jgi:hypothetical protein
MPCSLPLLLHNGLTKYPSILHFCCVRDRSYAISLLILILILDVDECSTSPCDDNGECTNNVGSFTCECTIGYSGNGFTCEGKIDVL